MPLFQQVYYPDLNNVIYYDDFVGASYNSRIWGTTVTGGSAVTSLSEVGGRLRVNATAGGNSIRFNHGNNGAYALANNARVYWRARMFPAATGTVGTGLNGSVECGLQSVTNPTTDYCCWRYFPLSNANFRCVCRATTPSSGTNDQSSGVAGNNLDHIFGIETTSTAVLFYLDGVLRQTLATYLTSDNCQPYINCIGSSTPTSAASYVEPCWCDIRGTRN